MTDESSKTTEKPIYSIGVTVQIKNRGTVGTPDYVLPITGLLRDRLLRLWDIKDGESFYITIHDPSLSVARVNHEEPPVK